MISSASIDVKLSASPYNETAQAGERRRRLPARQVHLQRRRTSPSKEPDYKANTTYFSISQDMFGDLTTLTLGYRRGWDQIYRDIKNTDGQIIQRPDLPRARRSPGLLTSR